jgi:hypothetical protein
MKYIRNINEKFAFYQVEEQDIFNSVDYIQNENLLII